MPYIKLTTTKKLTFEQKQALSEGLTEAVKVIPNKVVIFLFVEDGKTVFVANKEQEDIVFLEFDLTGHFDIETKRAFSAAACPVITRIIGTPPEGISMRITEHSCWGNFGDFVECQDNGLPVGVDHL